jgi:hypothetical protein
MHTNFFASQNVSCKRNESKFYSRISYYASVSRHRAKWTPKSLMKMLLVYLAEYSPRNIAANLPDCTQQLVQWEYSQQKEPEILQTNKDWTN